MKTLTRNPIFVLAAFLVLFSLLLQAGASRVDVWVRVVLWTAVVTISLGVVLQAIRYGRPSLPRRFRRWAMDEPDDKHE
jgi:NhaP-type Na+/H+ or K+/H+ antiporter